MANISTPACLKSYSNNIIEGYIVQMIKCIYTDKIKHKDANITDTQWIAKVEEVNVHCEF